MDIRYTITVAGNAVSEKVAVREIKTCMGVNQISQLTLLIEDGDMAAESFFTTDADLFKMGKEIVVKAGIAEAQQQIIYIGVITEQSIGYDRATYLQVIARGDVNKLCQAKLSKLYDPKTSDTDIITDLLSGAGATAGKIAKSEIKHHQFLMIEQSPWDMLMHRALVNGFVLCDEGKADVVDLKKHQPGTHTFNLAMDGCIDFELSVDTSSHLKKTQYTGWDIKEQALLANADPLASSYKYPKHADADAAFSLPAQLCHAQAPVDKTELAASATAEVHFRLLDMYQGRVRIDMSSKKALKGVKLLDALTVSGVGKLSAGEYLVGEIHHHISDRGWYCEYVLGVPLTRTLWSPWQTLPPAAPVMAKVAAFQKDDEALQRIPVLLPTATNKKVVWARLLTPFAGKEEGVFLPPDLDTEVLVDFIGGDARYPVIIGACHNPKVMPPFAYDDKNEQRGIFFKEPALAVQFTLKEPHLLLKGSKDQTITFGQKQGYALAQKDMATITAKDTLNLMSKDKAMVDLSKDIHLKADGNATIEAKATDVK